MSDRKQELAFKKAMRLAKKKEDRKAAALMYSDWLEEEGRDLDAARVRAREEISEIRYAIRQERQKEGKVLTFLFGPWKRRRTAFEFVEDRKAGNKRWLEISPHDPDAKSYAKAKYFLIVQELVTIEVTSEEIP